MSFASDVVSPGFASRIAKEAKGTRKTYDGQRKYPIGQEKYIRSGVLPNVRLKSHSKPVVRARRAPTSPLLPLVSHPSSPFSSSSIASGFLASASTRIPDISSVVSVLDSTTTSGCESIKDPTSVQAVVAALEQAQSLKSGIKRSRFGETEDSNKKQKCSLDSSCEKDEFPSPVVVQPHGSISSSTGGGGEKRALDLSPSIGTGGSPNHPQLSPENKRRCVPDPRVASFSSSKNLNTYVAGRDTPISMYESHQDSDSESNKSLESHHSKQSDRSYRGQNNDISGMRISSQDQFDRSGSQTPQSMRGSYGLVGTSNGSNSSSRTTTPSKPSHVFSLDAYKADKAKNHQRLNKMLGMLFNVSDEENDAIQASQSTAPIVPSANTVIDSVVNSQPLSISDNVVNPQPLSLSISTSGVSSSFQSNSVPKESSSSSASDLLKEAFSKVQPEVVPDTCEFKAKENETTDNNSADVSATFLLTLNKATKQIELPNTSNGFLKNSEVLKTNEDLVSNVNSVIHLPSSSSNSEATNNSSPSVLSAISELKSFTKAIFSYHKFLYE
ncbi:hypothetical protein Anas_09756 [Armadillidium nasatum]|uniref:Uncharacterized protein n=1 Tax=Armadillidium nasatum TaxID=96803 RepID=A0A5N5TD73_9CRUS|nr:hypothetical protein Anas_09756 [Armadillidium nasatum]